jgi:hypothetical protein
MSVSVGVSVSSTERHALDLLTPTLYLHLLTLALTLNTLCEDWELY